MTKHDQIPFGRHAVAALGSSMLVATGVALLIFALLLLEPRARVLNTGQMIAVLSSLVWAGTFLIAFPTSGLAFSLLWPVTRHRRAGVETLCIVAGATLGIVLAPIGSEDMASPSGIQLLTFALIGAATGGAYVSLLRQRPARAAPIAQATTPVEVPDQGIAATSSD